MSATDGGNKVRGVIQPEKISELRNERENELINGGVWIRELPPPPVLPPFGELEKISGLLESFSYERFREHFGPEVYRSSHLHEVSNLQRAAGAAVAIGAESPGLGAVMMMEDDSTETAEYIQGVINGKPYRGWVGQTRLKPGDYVDMVVEWHNDHYEVYAITLPEERIISVCPGGNEGSVAYMFRRLKNMLLLVIIIMTMFVVALSIKSIFNEGQSLMSFLNEYVGLFIIMTALCFLVTGTMAFFSCKVRFRTCCKLSENIFRALSMKNISTISLAKTRKAHIIKLKKEGRWCFSGNTDESAYPSSKYSISRGEWYYY